MNTRDYLTKIHIDLQDHNPKKLLTHNPTNAIAHDALHYMHSQLIIDMTTMEFLLPARNKDTPLFYELPEMHKPNCPLRPVVLGCDGPTDRLSSYITHVIQPKADNLPSNIKDTKHFLNFIENLPSFPTNALLVTADVTLLYTRIQHDDGISGVINFMEK